MPAVTASVAAGVLTVNGDDADNWIDVYTDGADLAVTSRGEIVGRFTSAGVTSIALNGNGGDDILRVEPDVTQPATIDGGSGRNKLKAGFGNTTLLGGAGRDVLVGNNGVDTFNGGGGENLIERYQSQPNDPPVDILNPNPGDRIATDAVVNDPNAPGGPQQTLTASDVEALLQRASAASASNDAIIAITDRNGRILGVRVENGVDPGLLANNELKVFAIDGAVSLARTGAFFGNDDAPLTSRTVGFISQSTITEREVDSYPFITDPNSTDRGPGYVAAVGINGHFPPNIALTPQVDLFQIEHTNRDGTFAAGPDGIIGTADDIKLDDRFGLDTAYVPPGQELFPTDSFGYESGLSPTVNGNPVTTGRGIATLPGGIPIYKNGEVVGGIGVFFPGKTGFATEENSSRSTTFDPTKPDRTLEAEFMALAAVGGVQGVLPVTGPLGGVALPAGIIIPIKDPQRIDLVGIQLDVFGPGGREAGVQTIFNELQGDTFKTSIATVEGTDQELVKGTGITTRGGLRVPDGWLVLPHDGAGITAAEVTKIITDGLIQAEQTRAAIRLGLGTRAKFVFAVADRNGDIVGLYREPDATVFSIDVAVAKARNVAYFANPALLSPLDQVAGVPVGAALTNRTFRYLAEPRFPEGIDGAPPGPYSQLNDDPGTDPLTGLQVGPRLPASAYTSVLGHDSFNPGTNFHDSTAGDNTTRQDGIVFFPGSSPLYRAGTLVGGLGVSGDGVDQDDVTTGAAASLLAADPSIRADQFMFNGVRLPYQKTNRNPEG
jgi:uncharacterized protein GlcG (DUF336 family)